MTKGWEVFSAQLREKARSDNFAAMSTAKLPSQQIRASLHDRVDKLSDDELEQAERQLEVFDLKRRLDELCGEYGEDWRAGRATQEMVDEAIRSYRARQPHRAPEHP